MKAAVLHEFGNALAFEELPTPEIHGEEVLVRVYGAGICRTDLHIIAGRFETLPLPRVLGHEIAGNAEGIGNVIVYPCWGCGSCEICDDGEEQLCPNAREAGWVCDGGYAEYVKVPSGRYLIPLDGLDPVQAAPLADAGVTPYRAVRRVQQWLQDGGTAVVMGVGGLGQFAIQYLKLLTDAHVVAVDPDEAKHSVALELGADEAVFPEDADRPARAVLDFVGSNETLGLTNQLVERAGVAILVGEAGGHLTFGMGDVPQEAHFTTSVWGSQEDLKAVLEYARQDKIKWDVETLPLERINSGLDRLRSEDVLGRLVATP